MSFIKNSWYVAGWSKEFENRLGKLRVLGQDLVAFRSSQGIVKILLDCCPHKHLPLSMGCLIDDNIQCGYHGATFSGDGSCIRVPGQDVIPKAAHVRSYPIHESNDIVWVWMGNPDKADPKTILRLQHLESPNWAVKQGDALHIKSNYINIAENLIDPAHVSFVHPTTLGNQYSQDIPINFKTDEEPITAWRWIRNAPPIGFFKEYGNFTNNVDRWQYYYLHLPSTAVIDFGSSDAKLNLADEDRHLGLQIFAIHFLTPVSETQTIDRWMHIRNSNINDDAIGEKIDSMLRTAFEEDKIILESIQLKEANLSSKSNLTFKLDKASSIYRNRIESLRKLETHETIC